MISLRGRAPTFAKSADRMLLATLMAARSARSPRASLKKTSELLGPMARPRACPPGLRKLRGMDLSPQVRPLLGQIGEGIGTPEKWTTK